MASVQINASFCASQLAAWMEKSPHPLTRLLSSTQARRRVGAAQIRAALIAGRWSIEPGDLCDPWPPNVDNPHATVGQGSALLALLSSNPPSLLRSLLSPSCHFQPGSLNPEEVELARHLVGLGCDPHADLGPAASNAITQAFLNGDIELLEEWLAGGWDWRSHAIEGPYPLPWLHLAAQAGALPVLEVLARHGMDIQQATADGTTALFLAKNEPTVTWLVDHGINVNAHTTGGVNALAYWQGTRGLLGGQLDAMQKAMGKLEQQREASFAIACFFEACKTLSSTRLDAERRRLKIVGHERHNGRSILDAAVARVSESGDSRSIAWLNKVLAWPEAMAAASAPDLGRLWVYRAMKSDQAIWPSDSTAREASDQHQAALAALEKYLEQPTWSARLITVLSSLPGGLSAPDTVSVFLAALSGARHPRASLHGPGRLNPEVWSLIEASLQSHPTSAGWSAPGVLAALLSRVANERNAKDHGISDRVLRLAIESGARWGEPEEVLLDRYTSRHGLHPVLLDNASEMVRRMLEIKAISEQLSLSASTPSVREATAASSPRRLRL